MSEQPDTEKHDHRPDEAKSGPVIKTEADPYQQGSTNRLAPIERLYHAWRHRRIFPPTPWVRILEWLAVGAACLYTVFTYQLLHTTQEGVHTGQRAYLLIENVRLHGKLDICNDRPKYGEMNVTLAPGTPMWLQWDIKNAGLTPALNIRQRFSFYVGQNAPASGGGEPFGGTKIALGPGECDPSPDAPWVWLDRRHEGAADRIWKTADAAQISAGLERLWVVISVDYNTAFGQPGLSTFCGYYDNSLFSSCGNIVK